jgi:hypothetical protein
MRYGIKAAQRVGFGCAIAVLGCASSPRPQQTTVMMSCDQVTQDESVDTVVRFQTKLEVDSLPAAGEAVGTVVSAHDGTPIQSAQVWISFPPDRHTPRGVITDAEGQFRLVGLPADSGVLSAKRIGLKSQSIDVDLRHGVRVRFALRINPLRLNCLVSAP